MKILFVTPYQPNLIRVRPYQLLKHLAGRGHEITLVYYDTTLDPTTKKELSGFCHSIYEFNLSKMRILINGFGSLKGSIPFQAMYGWQAAMMNFVNQLLQQEPGFDVIHIEHIRAVNYGLSLRNDAHKQPVIIWDSVDSITHLFRQAANQHPNQFMRWFLKWEVKKTARYEPFCAKAFDSVLVTSQKDLSVYQELLTNTNWKAQLNVLPNGVDLDYFKPNPEVMRESDTLVITGKMSYHANQKMVLRLMEEIMPLVWEKNPHVKVWIVGNNPGEKILKYNRDIRVNVTGWVPDMRPFLQKATMAIAPLAYGAGIQNKVLEAMACETPVITTTSANHSLQAKNDSEIMIADRNEDFAEKILGGLQNHTKRHAIAKAGRKFVEDNHSWYAIATELEEIYLKALQQATRLI